ncbi:MAG TPA: acylphosphatase [Chthonomonadales bacterium]|nr:acylphosphatase [Chthonomonadales bacterium]
MIRRTKMVVSGRVQGVAFRAATLRRAEELQLRGYVRNLPTGDVEIVAEGAAESVEALAAWARRGPPAAQVARLSIQEAAGGDELSDFCVRY